MCADVGELTPWTDDEVNLIKQGKCEEPLILLCFECSISFHHGLRGSASPVLTATGFVNGRWQFSTPHRIHTP